VVEAINQGSQTLIHAVDGHETISRPDPLERNQQFNKLTVQHRDGKVRFLVNDFQIYEEEATRQSPWVNLFASFARRGAFRNPRFSGTPTPPGEAALPAGTRLGGGVAAAFYEPQPRRRVLAEPEPTDNRYRRGYNDREEPAVYDGEARGGELIGNRRDD